mgnify:CR=1 FL=1
MLMRGDLEKIFNQINPVFETAFNRIDALDARVKELEKEVETLKTGKNEQKRGPGRPKKAA